MKICIFISFFGIFSTNGKFKGLFITYLIRISRRINYFHFLFTPNFIRLQEIAHDYDELCRI